MCLEAVFAQKISEKMSKELDRKRFEVLMALLQAQFMGAAAESWDVSGMKKLGDELMKISKMGLDPSDSALKKWVGMDRSYNGVPTLENRNALAQVAGFEGWQQYVEKRCAGSPETLGVTVPSTRYKRSGIAVGVATAIATISCLLLLRSPGYRPILPFWLSWATGASAIVLGGLVLLLERFSSKTKVFGWRNRLFPKAHYWNAFWVCAGLMLVLIAQLLLFRPVRFSLHSRLAGAGNEVVTIDREHAGPENQRIANLSGLQAVVVWLPIGMNGLIIGEVGDAYPVGDRLQIKMGFSEIEYIVK
jgi:hypothetical protein